MNTCIEIVLIIYFAGVMIRYGVLSAKVSKFRREYHFMPVKDSEVLKESLMWPGVLIAIIIDIFTSIIIAIKSKKQNGELDES